MSIDRGVHLVLPSHHPTLRGGQACPECGFLPNTVAVPDAIVALRSFPRRYRAALVAPLAEDGGAELVRFRPPDDWSALEYTAHVRDAMHALDKRLTRVLIEDDPVLPELSRDVPPSGAHDQGAEVVLATLLTNIEAITRTAQGVGGEDWSRTGRLDGEEVRAVDLLAEAVHEGAHHLRDVDRVLAEAHRTLHR